MKFFDGDPVVRYMLQDVFADDQIEGIRVECQREQVFATSAVLRSLPGRHIIEEFRTGVVLQVLQTLVNGPEIGRTVNRRAFELTNAALQVPGRPAGALGDD